ncbi:MAG: type-F conjugative transfer system pilin assembly protein TraF [Candidatus Obscuribacterales bacterium]
MGIARYLPLLLCFASPLCADWHAHKSEGWAWYEDPKSSVNEPIEPTALKAPSKEIAEARESLEAKLALALLEPTEENVLAYMAEQNHWLEQSALFSNTWLRLLLQNPELDPTAFSRPTSHYGLQIYKQEQQKAKEALIQSVAQTHGLFFFYEGASYTATTFAQLVQELSNKYGWQVIAISVDGTQVQGFENNRLDNGISEAFGVTVFPALYAVDPKTEEAIPLAFGLASLDQIEDKIVLQFDSLEVSHE